MLVQSWTDWQQAVIVSIRRHYGGILADIDTEEVDWDAWRPLFDEGRSPDDAVLRAFARDL